MASLASIRYNILNLKSGGRESDDDSLSRRQTDYIIGYIRALLIRRDFEKGHSINPDIIQDLGCIHLSPVDEADCCNVTVGCQILRSDKQLPKALELYDKNMITYVGTVDKRHAFDLIPVARSRWVNFNKYSKGHRRAFILNRYLYVINDKMLEYINVRGVFEDPIEAANFNHCDGTPCFSENDQYPIALHMIQPLTSMVVAGEIKDTFVFPADTKNDSVSENASLPTKGRPI
jgi:hypothetical protein